MQPHYLTSLEARQIDEKHWQLLSPLVYCSPLAGEITVPEGFITDFATVPRLPVIYARFGRKGDKAAVIHDYLYTKKELHGVSLERDFIDNIYKEALLSIPVKKSTALWMWIGVRACGWLHYYPMFKKGA